MAGGMNWVEVLDRQQLQAATDLAASDSSPHVEWLFIRDARSLLNAGEYRRAVIDACRPFERLKDFPKVARASPELRKQVAEKFADVLKKIGS